MTLIIVQTKVTSVIFYLEQINAASHILYVAFSLVNFFFFAANTPTRTKKNHLYKANSAMYLQCLAAGLCWFFCSLT